MFLVDFLPKKWIIGTAMLVGAFSAGIVFHTAQISKSNVPKETIKIVVDTSTVTEDIIETLTIRNESDEPLIIPAGAVIEHKREKRREETHQRTETIAPRKTTAALRNNISPLETMKHIALGGAPVRRDLWGVYGGIGYFDGLLGCAGIGLHLWNDLYLTGGATISETKTILFEAGMHVKIGDVFGRDISVGVSLNTDRQLQAELAMWIF